MTRHSFLSTEERSEKRFVHSSSLPREKQARATLQRSEAARCLSQENDTRRTKKAQSFSLENNCTCLQSQKISPKRNPFHIAINHVQYKIRSNKPDDT